MLQPAEYEERCADLYKLLHDRGVAAERECTDEKPDKLCSVAGWRMRIDATKFAEPPAEDRWNDLRDLSLEERLAFASRPEFAHVFQTPGRESRVCQYSYLLPSVRADYEARSAVAKPLSRLQKRPEARPKDFTRSIVLFLAKERGKERKMRTVDEIWVKDPDKRQFYAEVLGSSDLLRLSPAPDTSFVSLFLVPDSAEAEKHGLPWGPGDGAPYVYMPLVCACVLEGCARGQALLAEACAQVIDMGCRTLVLSALPHVAMYYYNKLDARFIDPQLQDVVLPQRLARTRPPLQPRGALEIEGQRRMLGLLSEQGEQEDEAPRSTRARRSLSKPAAA